MSNLYIGVDLGKKSHVASFLSAELLQRHRRFSACPVLVVVNEQAGFDKLLGIIKKNSTPEETTVLLEHTGHYGAALIQFLQVNGIQVYRMHVHEHHRWDKTDTKDAQHLAVLLYNQLAMNVLPGRGEELRPLVQFPDEIRILRTLVRHRYELTQETTRRKNKLTSIYDEVFPEFVQIYKDPNSDSALNLREKYPTPDLIARAPLVDLAATRKRTQPSSAKLKELQKLAKKTIGSKDTSRLSGLVLEQGQLIEELRLMHRHIDILENQIEQIITASREGQILLSMGCGAIQAATILAGIGSIGNFESAAKLKGYMGWIPRRQQTGTSLDKANLTKSGNRLLKQTLFMVSINLITHNLQWKALYTRLVDRKCEYDPVKKKYKGKMKVIARIASQLIEMMYLLLRKDYDLLQSLAPGEEIPAPTLYEASKHKVKRPLLELASEES